MDNRSPYLSAKQLGITDWERAALIALIGPLSRDELAFDMEKAWANECGAACCIGGWVALQAGKDKDYMGACTDPSHPLYRLYFPVSRVDCPSPYDATGPQGARAIVNFLTAADPYWSTIMA